MRTPILCASRPKLRHAPFKFESRVPCIILLPLYNMRMQPRRCCRGNPGSVAYGFSPVNIAFLPRGRLGRAFRVVREIGFQMGFGLF